MEEIKFRGQRIDTGEWVYGNGVVVIDDKYVAIPQTKDVTHDSYEMKMCKVTPSTVGQFAWLNDKNGQPIYNGDILRVPPSDDWEKINYSCFEVFFHDGDANSDYNIGYSINRMHNHGSVGGGYIPSFKPRQVSKMIVIGNIIDNPELITKR